jgi:hypothetical protein
MLKAAKWLSRAVMLQCALSRHRSRGEARDRYCSRGARQGSGARGINAYGETSTFRVGTAQVLQLLASP